jgi:hypothetical protein
MDAAVLVRLYGRCVWLGLIIKHVVLLVVVVVVFVLLALCTVQHSTVLVLLDENFGTSHVLTW